MSRNPTSNPFPIINNPLYIQQKPIQYFTKNNVEQTPKNTTPVRFRILQPNQHLNTPYQIIQKPSIDHGYSPINRINKENYQNIQIQPSPTKLTVKGKPGNMNQFIKNIGIPRPKSPIDEPSKKQIGNKQQMNIISQIQGKKNSIGSQPYSMISSKSPNKLCQKKIKTQVIQDIIKNCGKQQNNLKKSDSKTDIQNYSSNKLQQNPKIIPRIDSKKSFKTLGKQSVQNLFGKQTHKKSQSNNNSALICINDGKKAKYKVKADQQDQDQPMYCCSKCAICLVQQGFKVIEIENTNINDYNSITNARQKQLKQFLIKVVELNKKISLKKDKVKKGKQLNQKNYLPQLNRIDSYYDSLISALQQLRVRDRQTVIHYRNNSQRDVQNIQKQLNSAIQRLQTIDNDIRPSIQTIKNQIQQEDYSRFMKQYNQQIKQMTKLLEVSDKCYQKQIQVEYQIQQKFDAFINILHSQFTIKISKILSNQPQNMMNSKGHNNINTLQNPLTTFQDKLLQSKRSKGQVMGKLGVVFRQAQIEQQQEQDKQQEQEQELIKQEKKAFRNLFPDESDQQLHICEEKLDHNLNYEDNNKMLNCEQQNYQQNQICNNEENQNQQCCSPNFKKI